MKKIHFHIIGLFLFALLSMSMGSIQTGTSQSDKIVITATTSIVADAVENVGGNFVEVNTLIITGVDPHDYEPRPSDIELINSSDYIFWSGGEESLSQILEFWEGEGKAINLLEQINEADLIETDHEEDDEDHDHGLFDPHYYLDPIIWKQGVEAIAVVLSNLDPVNSATYNQNMQNYLLELDALDTNIRDQVENIPESDRFLVTQHDSFSYFAKAYDFTAKSLQGISTETEAGIQDIDELAQFIVDNDIKVVFSEDTSDTSDMEAVLDAARAQNHGVVIAGSLFVGSLGTDSQTDNYIGMMQYNADLIVSNILNPPEDTSVLNNSLLGPFGMIGFAIIVVLVRKNRMWYE